MIPPSLNLLCLLIIQHRTPLVLPRWIELKPRSLLYNAPTPPPYPSVGSHFMQGVREGMAIRFGGQGAVTDRTPQTTIASLDGSDSLHGVALLDTLRLVLSRGYSHTSHSRSYGRSWSQLA
jgi:hypothetical protein